MLGTHSLLVNASQRQRRTSAYNDTFGHTHHRQCPQLSNMHELGTRMGHVHCLVDACQRQLHGVGVQRRARDGAVRDDAHQPAPPLAFTHSSTSKLGTRPGHADC